MTRYPSVLREIRTRLDSSQAECATALGVAVETFRTWDAGRRLAPEAIVSQARTLKAKRALHDRVALQVLADELHVHVRTLRDGLQARPRQHKADNRVAALGENLILLVSLAWSAWLYARFIRHRGSFGALERWQVTYLPVYSVWAALVVVVFPPVFGYR